MKRGMGSPKYDPAVADAARRKGCKAMHDSGQAHHWDGEEAKEAGRKGGLSRAANKAARDQGPPA